MSKLLYIKSSPRGKMSYSVTTADAFVETYRSKNPRDEVVTLNLFEQKLMPFDGFALQAKYSLLHGKNPTEEEKRAWKNVEDIIATFKSADKYVFAVPMWNFGIPYILKQYLDLIIQPGYTFSFSPSEGYKGLVLGKPAFVAYARGGEYAPGTPEEAYDFQKKYFELALGFMGITDVKSVVIEPTLAGGPDAAKTKQDAAIANALKIASEF